ncbi:unnamed protein product [Caenorhabditis sp. 36 PRJEB53466]|nr:unnamed protein product [Caenorhabditis sp. 36 PRJEB53466]
MKPSSTNAIMIGIAISDIFTLVLTVEKYLTLVDTESNECITSDSLLKVYIDMLAWALQDYLRRCSTWLALLMATVRTLIVRNALNTNHSRLSTRRFGWLTVVLTFSLASMLSVFYYFRFKIVENRQSALPISCEEFQDIHRTPRYTLTMAHLFAENDEIVLRVYLMIDAIASKFIPCLCFPILTMLLIRALRKAKHAQNSAKQSQNPTTKLVILMTIAFFLAEAPLGFIVMIKAFFHDNHLLIIASVDVVIVFACLLTQAAMLNATCAYEDETYVTVLHYTCTLVSIPVYSVAFGVLFFKCPRHFNQYRNYLVIHIISGALLEIFMGVIWNPAIPFPWAIICCRGLAAEYAPNAFQVFICLLIFTGISAVSLFIYRMEQATRHAPQSRILKSVQYSRYAFYLSIGVLFGFTVAIYPKLTHQNEYKLKMSQERGALEGYMWCDNCYFMRFDSWIFFSFVTMAYVTVAFGFLTGGFAAVIAFRSLNSAAASSSAKTAAIQKNFLNSLLIMIIVHTFLIFIPLALYLLAMMVPLQPSRAWILFDAQHAFDQHVIAKSGAGNVFVRMRSEDNRDEQQAEQGAEI